MNIVRDAKLKVIAESFRDWGRDCWCEPGKDNTCGKRFDQQFGTLPQGYDHKYVYSHIGYNLKVTDMQAAVGVAQLKKLDGFIEAMVKIQEEAEKEPDTVKSAPHTLPARRLDDVRAARELDLKWRPAGG